MSYLTTSRCRLYYEDTAEQDPSQKEKPAILFVNGWAISSRYWKPTIELLKSEYRCITYDQSGTGKTSIDGLHPDLTIAGFANEAGALIEHMGLDKSRKLHIVGHSMGGMVATELCLRYKDALLSSTILACGIFEETPFTSLGLMFLGGLIDVSMSFRNIFQVEPLRSLFIKRAATEPISKEYSDIIIEDFTTSDKAATNAVGHFSIDPVALRTYTRSVIEIASPVLCCVGMADHTIPPEGTVTLFEKRKASASSPTRLVQFMHLGHLPMLEDTARFVEELKKHFEFAQHFYKKTQPSESLAERVQIP
ncbi:alpha/beta hydrolase fold [Chlorobaculum parvum NCIB 8327]|uniref:Alpha/beta hydrolase fold n=1 Tax=Chlorobaculum parvum (strain DSM 263 / NCIMB 8327) TaxID=517417 RepID=B3QQQ5_CHLP8|nr:alpha/beta hydrolase [Chlorobaculum parvum]ACF12258.1 alpha/beta hydrolase fold [Chlorobaculum parvum NCIB 8327]